MMSLMYQPDPAHVEAADFRILLLHSRWTEFIPGAVRRGDNQAGIAGKRSRSFGSVIFYRILS
jgi:hypothetical protein